MRQGGGGENAEMQQASGVAPNNSLNPFATTKNKYFDNFAASMPAGANQSLNTPTYAQQKGNLQTNASRGPKTELDRLLQEREELVQTGCYTEKDPLIQEMDRQIKANTLKLTQSQQ